MDDINPIEKRIIEAAKSVFIEKGLEATKMKDIAIKAEISRTSLNYYYRSKGKLFDTIVDQLISIFAPMLLKIVENEKSFEDKIDHFIDEYTELIIENPQYPYFLITEITRSPEQFVEIFKKKIIDIGGPIDLQQKLLYGLPIDLANKIDLPQLVLSILSLLITPKLLWPIYSNITSTNVPFEVFYRKRKNVVKNMIKSQIFDINK